MPLRSERASWIRFANSVRMEVSESIALRDGLIQAEARALTNINLLFDASAFELAKKPRPGMAE